MNTTQTILSRKTIRNFNGQQPTQEELFAVLQAGQASPVGMKAYGSLLFTVVTSPRLIDFIENNAKEKLGREGKILYGAPVLIVVSTDVKNTHSQNVAYSNAAIAVHNMALQAVELGLGACQIWGAVAMLNQNEQIVKEFDLPDGFVPACALAVGKTEEVYTTREIPQDRIKTVFIKD